MSNENVRPASRFRTTVPNPVDFEPLRWMSTDLERDLDANDLREDRMSFLYSADGTDHGVVTHYVTASSFGAHVARIDPMPDDPRWRCAGWLEHVLRIREGAHRAFAASIGFEAVPPRVGLIVSALDPFTLTWECASGGGVEILDLESVGPCGQCVGCENPVSPVGPLNPASWVYFVQSGNGGPVKIGRSASPRVRISSLQTASPYDLRILAVMPGAAVVERAFHEAFVGDRIRANGEWFRPSTTLMAFIKEIGGR